MWGLDTAWNISSPDKNVVITVFTDKQDLRYNVKFGGKDVILNSSLGIDRQDEQFSTGLVYKSQNKVKVIDEKYTLKSGKKLNCHNYANEQILTFSNANGKEMHLVLRAYNDGIAFRYYFSESSKNEHKIVDEITNFALSTNGRAWIHPYDWNNRKKPSYEQYCKAAIPIGSDSPYEQGWAYPMLFNTPDGLWTMITEAAMDGTYCGTHVRSTKDGVYKIHFAEKEEVVLPDNPEPVSVLPWATPWRVVIIGNRLSDIVESNMVQNLNPASVITDESWINPGRSSWSWWSVGSSAHDFQAQKDYVDFSAEMTWEYSLIDAGWPRMKGGTMEEVVKYAKSKGVGIWLWYHSGVGMATDSVSYFNIMSIPEERKKELARIQALGVKGIKVDFFDTDKQKAFKLFKDILHDASEHQIMVNFHGASLPRGMERTYPNLMTTEAIKGAEAFGRQPACNIAPVHNTIVPFTRNVVGSMDYTPVTFSNKIRQGVEAFMVTSWTHQLALAVVFESGVQNFADNHKTYEALPEAPKNFLKEIPVAWDETKLVDGYPGDYVIIARRKGNRWYIGGINGKNESRELSFDLPFVPSGKTLEMIVDGSEQKEFASKSGRTGSRISVKLLPYGGFTGVVF